MVMQRWPLGSRVVRENLVERMENKSSTKSSSTLTQPAKVQNITMSDIRPESSYHYFQHYRHQLHFHQQQQWLQPQHQRVNVKIPLIQAALAALRTKSTTTPAHKDLLRLRTRRIGKWMRETHGTRKHMEWNVPLELCLESQEKWQIVLLLLFGSPHNWLLMSPTHCSIPPCQVSSWHREQVYHQLKPKMKNEGSVLLQKKNAELGLTTVAGTYDLPRLVSGPVMEDSSLQGTTCWEPCPTSRRHCVSLFCLGAFSKPLEILLVSTQWQPGSMGNKSVWDDPQPTRDESWWISDLVSYPLRDNSRHFPRLQVNQAPVVYNSNFDNTTLCWFFLLSLISLTLTDASLE